MNLKDARILCNKIREWGAHCVVPTGFGPDGYWAEIQTSDFGQVTFFSESDWSKYKSYREAAAAMAWKRQNGRLSPLEMMIDKACGYKD